METQLLFTEDAYLREFEAEVRDVRGNAIVLDRTAFYYTSGGQPGDKGVLSVNDNALAVEATIRDRESGQVLHILPEGAVCPPVGTKLRATIDWETRHKQMRMHTALHLLCALIDGAVTGGQIGADKSRLDFNLENSPDKDELTQKLNELVAADHPVRTKWITDAELEANPDLVRTMSVSPPRGAGRIRLLQIGTDDNMIDLQPCGGTHVRSTAEIGRLAVVKIENKGKQNRRIVIEFAS